MLTPCFLSNWFVVLPSSAMSDVQDWVNNTFKRVALGVGIQYNDPSLFPMENDRAHAYQEKCREVAAKKPTFVMVITRSANTNDIYRVIKTVLMVENPIPNQVVTLQKVINKNKKGVRDMSKATKVALQV